MSNKILFQKAKKLKFPKGKYAIFGSGPLGIRGLKNCHDVDIVVTEELWNDCQQKGWEINASPLGSQSLQKEEIELFKDWKPGYWDIQKLINKAEIIDELPFVRLEYVVD